VLTAKKLFLLWFIALSPGCTTVPAYIYQHTIEAGSGKTEKINVHAWNRQQLCVKITINELTFHESITPQLALEFTSAESSHVASIKLIATDLKDNNFMLDFVLSDNANKTYLQSWLRQTPFQFNEPVELGVKIDKDDHLSITLEQKSHTFQIPYHPSQLRFTATSARGDFQYTFACDVDEYPVDT
jgi:hypothetical protein